MRQRKGLPFTASFRLEETMTIPASTPIEPDALALKEHLGARHIVLVGLMGAGKTSVGKRLAAALGLNFVDSDHAIEESARMTIPEIFAARGEAEFRAGERKVIARLLSEPPQVIATGGGAFMDSETRERIKDNAVSLWLKAELPVLMKRVLRRNNRPLLQNGDPEATMRALIEKRYPVYAEADVTVLSEETPHETMVRAVINALNHALAPETCKETTPMSKLPPRSVRVDLAGRSYDILIGRGLLDHAGSFIAEATAKARACLILTDENVAPHHLPTLQRGLDAGGLLHSHLIVPPGEKTKNWGNLQNVVEAILANKLERGDLVVALGGGVIGDLAGFAAAVTRRGMRFIQIPTSLLAQVDSSVGGKTGINSPVGKNLIGAFHQPSLVLADTALLDTLPPRERRAGYAEIIKYGLIDRPDFYEWLENGAWQGVIEGGQEREEAVAISCQCKAAIVARDEHETGDRALLNLGHTFGHALEALVAYNSDRLVHGEGVSIGMAMAHRFSAHLGLCSQELPSRVAAHLDAVGLPIRLDQVPGGTGSAEEILEAIKQDKKVSRGTLTFILTRGLGQSFIAKGVEEAKVLEFLKREGA